MFSASTLRPLPISLRNSTIRIACGISLLRAFPMTCKKFLQPRNRAVRLAAEEIRILIVFSQ